MALAFCTALDDGSCTRGGGAIGDWGPKFFEYGKPGKTRGSWYVSRGSSSCGSGDGISIGGASIISGMPRRPAVGAIFQVCLPANANAQAASQ